MNTYTELRETAMTYRPSDHYVGPSTRCPDAKGPCMGLECECQAPAHRLYAVDPAAADSAEGACGDYVQNGPKTGRRVPDTERELNRLVGFVVALIAAIAVCSFVVHIKSKPEPVKPAAVVRPLA